MADFLRPTLHIPSSGERTQPNGGVMISSAAIVSQRRVNRWFFISVALSMILLNVIGFGPSIVEPSGRKVPLPVTPLVVAHAIVSAAFLLLFLTQATLVAAGRTDLHRRLGIAGGVLALALIVLGYLTMIENARRGFDLSGDMSSLPLPSGVTVEAVMVGPIVNLLTFGILLGAGLCYRHRPDVHKRLMLLAVVGLGSTTAVGHVTGHWPALHPWANVIFPLSSAVFLSLSAVYDRAASVRIHAVSLWVPIVVFVSQTIFNILIVPSAAWGSFAAWLIR
jgi:hypothetical protein